MYKIDKRRRGTWVRNLRLHMESKHDGVIYHCLECDQLPQTTAQTLKVQIKYKLKGVRYSCDKYDLTTATICHLKTHIKNNHEGVRYPCDLCDYAATTNTALKIHVEAMQASV